MIAFGPVDTFSVHTPHRAHRREKGMSSSTSMSVVAVVLLVLAAAQPARADPACYSRLFNFGDSLSDTGNYHFVFPNDNREPAMRLPYGETFFNRSTGRFSNGRLIVDFIAEALELPFLRPYWSGQSAKDFARGANFAVGGATALSPEFFEENDAPLPNPDTVCLDKELDWFSDLLEFLCPNDLADCTNMMDKSLFLVGEIGGNDYNLPIFTEVSFEKIRTFTPSVIAKISSTVTKLIELGAKTLLVPGNLPIGCVPAYLMRFESDEEEYYEPDTGCIRWMNEFSQYHNKLLVDELEKLRKLHPGVVIIYADYYGAAMKVFRSPEQFGIKYPLVACCGGEGFYGVSETGGCGYGEYKVRDDPEKYGSWDGFHPSEAVYKAIANGLLRGPYTQPPIATTTNSCPQLTEIVSSFENKVLSDL
ncbi:GDSL esterase/lipase At1g28570 [Lolium perenne]|uniref:GDSL esterase/lipase At1g28570 n=1 Tax=Lolium perenne TaxID=4522 RepID=UPI0021F5D70C|nr:sinapine esterase-like [Lolium perenne]